MAYQRKRSPEVDRWARWQTLAAQLSALLMLVVMGVGVLLYADRYAPPQDLPWKPLSPAHPVGFATRAKLLRTQTDLDSCLDALGRGGVAIQRVADRTDPPRCPIAGAVLISGGVAPLRPAGAVLTCKLALPYAIWMRQQVQPAAEQLLGARVVGVDHYGSYACRNRYGLADTRLSEHATANALDVAGFRLSDGRTVSVLRDFRDPGPAGQFLRRVRDEGCSLFNTTLSPDYNAAHANHFHFDMGGALICR